MKYCPLCDKTYDDTVESCATDGATLRVLRSKQDPLIDKVIKGRYHVVKKLGEGGMGAVYLADQFAINRKVALKILHPDFAKDEDFVRRFRQEATLAASFSHQNVVTIFDFDQADDGSLYIVMEYVDGQNLSEVIRGNSIELARTLQLAIQIAGGLSAAHRAGVIHRDIKPENIMVVSGSKEIKLMDFGIARLRDRTATTRLTQTGMIMGTPVYMAPEQIEGGELSERTDIYAFGIVLYEMLTGQVPFKASTPGAILVKHLHDAPVPLTKIRKEISSSLERIVIQALQKSPEKRQQSMDQVVEALKKAQRDTEQNGGGAYSLAPRMAAVRRGFSAVAAPFRKFLAKGSTDTDRSGNPDFAEPMDKTSATENLASQPRSSTDLAMSGDDQSVALLDGLKDATRTEPTFHHTQPFEARAEQSPIAREQRPTRGNDPSVSPPAPLIAETVPFTAPLKIPERISETPERSADAHEVTDSPSIELEVARTVTEPGAATIADLIDSPSALNSATARETGSSLGVTLTHDVRSEYQATVPGAMSEIRVAPPNETISTTILAQRSETAAAGKKSWLVTAVMSVFVIALSMFGSVKLFQYFKAAPMDSTAKTKTSGTTASATLQSPEQPQIAEAIRNNNPILESPLIPDIPADKNMPEAPSAIKPLQERNVTKPVQQTKPLQKATVEPETQKTRESSKKLTEPATDRRIGSLMPPESPRPETKRIDAPNKNPSEPATESRIASLKPPDSPPAPRIELKDLLIVPNKKELKVKERMTLTVKGRYSDGKETDVTSRVQWKSSDASIASINSRGELEALKEGRAQITATYEGLASSSLVLNIKTAEDNRKPEDSGDQIKDLRRRLLR